jgi:phospholipid/cholesterol/gamma-HCH transport system permease protein
MAFSSTLLTDPAAAAGSRSLAPLRLLAWVGRLTRTGLQQVGRNTRFLMATGKSIGDVRTWGPFVSLHLRRLGVDSMPLAIFIALFTGVVLALLASYSLTGAVPPYFVGTLVEKTITMELAPVLTGLALAGRVGASIAAEVGTMRVTEQIDALETLAYHPLAYLVVPRVLAGVIMFPVVVAAAMLCGIGSGWLASTILLDISSTEFVKGMRLFFDPFDVQYGLVKSASFGLAVTLIGSVRGLRTHGGAEGVGRGATSAVVYSAVTILMLDAFWALLWLRGGGARAG